MVAFFAVIFSMAQGPGQDSVTLLVTISQFLIGRAVIFPGNTTYGLHTPELLCLSEGITLSFWLKHHKPGHLASNTFAGYIGSVFTFTSTVVEDQWVSRFILIIFLRPVLLCLIAFEI